MLTREDRERDGAQYAGRLVAPVLLHCPNALEERDAVPHRDLPGPERDADALGSGVVEMWHPTCNNKVSMGARAC